MTSSIDLAGASYAGQATTFAYVLTLLWFDKYYLPFIFIDGQTKFVPMTIKNELLSSHL